MDRSYADLEANGDSEWVNLREGGMVSVDCVDSSTGLSTSWGGASAALLFSPDTKMRCAVSDESGAVTGTDGYVRDLRGMSGFVAIAVTSYSDNKFRICVSR